ncbi:MAG: PAS domain S-box protein [Desulfuromonadaceae bacterium]|nr:PAS domain S-box protein [Desulfuromonadaceae bacterium]MDD2848085.1 PAS domain S-box protein [Desulfuromonadaceae bacterium]MDD4132074.1 PAS domain S-box protein [Desulfuromonadaceae bacterium]
MSSLSGFLNNAALMLILCVIYDTFGIYSLANKRVRDSLTGVLVGLISIAVMLNPWSLQPGVFFDTRWVLLSLCGLYFGFVPTAVAVVIAGAFRLYIGGPGGIVGTVVIVVTACIGLAWKYWKDRYDKPLNWVQLYVFGVVVQLAMLSCVLLMPAELHIPILKKTSAPILLIYPVLTMIIGLILKRQEDRRATEKELAESRKALSMERGLLRGVINSIPDLIFFKNTAGVYLGCNSSFEEFVGHEEQGVTGKTDFDLFDRDTAEFFVQKDNIIFTSGKARSNEEWVDYPDGRRVLLETVKTPLKDVTGTVYGLVGNSRDMTERQKAEDALRKSEEFLKEAQQIAHLGSWSLDLTLNHLSWSEEVYRIFGLHAEEFGATYEAFIDLVHPADRAMVEAAYSEYLHDGKDGFEIEHRIVRNSTGEVRTVHEKCAYLRDENGRISVLQGMIHDITDRKHDEEERLKLEQQLLHTQKLESLGVLAGGIAHDFNNILTSIVGNAELALMKMNPESPALDNLHRIEHAAERAADLAQQMLAYSGKGKFVVKSIDLGKMLEEMLHMLEVSISKKAVLRLNRPPNLPPVEADATQIRQIIMNLVINASEAIGDKSGVIAITTGCMDCDQSYLKNVWLDENIKEGLYVFLEVADTGCGMDKETQAKIFDPFFTTKFTGRGLGMAAVMGIVRGHNGAIKVYSEPGKGTSFKLLLPASGKPAEIFNGESPYDRWKGSGKVLLVDDEETVRGIGREMLLELGFEVVTSNDGREAVEIFRQQPDIAFVILDLTMPHMDGEQCFRELRQLKPDVKVIISSGFSEHEVTQMFIGKGLAGFIQKPYKLSALKEAIKSLY